MTKRELMFGIKGIAFILSMVAGAVSFGLKHVELPAQLACQPIDFAIEAC